MDISNIQDGGLSFFLSFNILDTEPVIKILTTIQKFLQRFLGQITIQIQQDS